MTAIESTGSVWSEVVGQTQAIERLTQAAKDPVHAYMFVGPDGIGKLQFAQRLAQSLLCQSNGGDRLDACGECAGCKPFLAGAHPDFLKVGCPEGKREENRKNIPLVVVLGPAGFGHRVAAQSR